MAVPDFLFCIGVSMLCPAIVQGQVTTATIYGNVTVGRALGYLTPRRHRQREARIVTDRNLQQDGRVHFDFLPSDATA